MDKKDFEEVAGKIQNLTDGQLSELLALCFEEEDTRAASRGDDTEQSGPFGL